MSIFVMIESTRQNRINGGGKQHRKKRNSYNILSNIKRDGFPNTYQILCHNCNLGKHLNGGICPHQILTIK